MKWPWITVVVIELSLQRFNSCVPVTSLPRLMNQEQLPLLIVWICLWHLAMNPKSLSTSIARPWSGGQTTQGWEYSRYVVWSYGLCWEIFNYNYEKWTGHTNGEGVECGWPQINSLAKSAREMTPGSWHDLLEDHIGDANWKKVTGFGEYAIIRRLL